MGINLEEYDCRLSTYDGKPIKNWLPDEIKEKFWTENQWLDKGMVLKKNAEAIEMHSHVNGMKLYKYYFETEVEPLTDEIEKCANCVYRYAEEGRCPVMGEFVSPKGHCSEWQGSRVGIG